MKYKTDNELDQFSFEDSYLSDLQTGVGLCLTVDNVKILPDNSCNRDIRTMRCNQLELRINEGKLVKLVQEGNKVYDANGKLLRQEEDLIIEEENYKETFELLMEKEIYCFEKTRSNEEGIYEYRMEVGADEHLYTLYFLGTGDSQSWDRFLNLGTTL